MDQSPGFQALYVLATALGVHVRYTDGLGREMVPPPETIVRLCAALGQPIADFGDAGPVLRELEAGPTVPPVIVAWEGRCSIPTAEEIDVYLALEDGARARLRADGTRLVPEEPLPLGYHRLQVGPHTTSTVISAPRLAWRHPDRNRSWGVSAQLAALRSTRSRSVGDLRDLETLCRWLRDQGGDLVTLLPLLPTFNREPSEPSPYSAVSRLFWSELMLDLGDRHRPVGPMDTLDVSRADLEVRAALADHPMPGADPELQRYARFRGAQARLGRHWREWPDAARAGRLDPEQVDPGEERFHLLAQTELRRQLAGLPDRLSGCRLGLDLAVGLHPDGYDPWSRPELFGSGLSVGAPPDRGFPSGQNWGFPPLLPAASRREGHRYLAAAIGHQMALADVLRVDHIMAWNRLYVIPDGMPLDQGTYLSYPAEELFAVLTLESHRHRCEVVGEDLGTVPPEIAEALPRHGIRGMYLTQFQAASPEPLTPPAGNRVAMIGSHDTPTFAGWVAGADIGERVQYGLLGPDDEKGARAARVEAVQQLADTVGADPGDRAEFLARVVEWLGGSASDEVLVWLEDLWLEEQSVNLPGTPSYARPNWRLPMSRLVDQLDDDAVTAALLQRLASARRST